jgi:hypothetical protein
LLLMIMALMVIMGSAGAWKVRTSANARQAILRAIYPRTTDGDPDPPNWWPASASMTYHGGGASFLTDDPYVDHYAVRGPYIRDPNTGNALRVLIDTLDMTQGMHSGQADINHSSAMWSRLGVRNDFTGENVIFAGQTWQYGNMGIPSNEHRRVTYTYDYEMSKYDQSAAARTRAAANAIMTNPHRQELMLLDRDAELRAWYGHNIDFHPQPGGCTRDPDELLRIVRNLLGRIDNVPMAMATRFRDMYQEQLDELNAMMPPPADLAARRADLQQKIDQLNDFIATLN